MIEIRVVCECGVEVPYKECSIFNGGSDRVHTIFTDELFICAQCGKYMGIQIVKVEDKTEETILN